MRQSGKNTRQRGRGGRRSNNFGQINRNTTLDSNGPDVRLRGNAQQLHEKYTSLGNEAAAAGERISAEAYYQYADHYFRVHSTIMANQEDRRQPQQSESSGSAPANGSDHDTGGDAAPTPHDDLSSASGSNDENEAAAPSKSPRQGARKTNGNGRSKPAATKSEDKTEDLSVADSEDEAKDIALPSSLIN